MAAVHYASELGQDEVLELLIKQKADINALGGPDKLAPMHIAIKNGQYSAVTVLFEKGKAS